MVRGRSRSGGPSHGASSGELTPRLRVLRRATAVPVAGAVESGQVPPRPHRASRRADARPACLRQVARALDRGVAAGDAGRRAPGRRTLVVDRVCGPVSPSSVPLFPIPLGGLTGPLRTKVAPLKRDNQSKYLRRQPVEITTHGLPSAKRVASCRPSRTVRNSECGAGAAARSTPYCLLSRRPQWVRQCDFSGEACGGAHSPSLPASPL